MEDDEEHFQRFRYNDMMRGCPLKDSILMDMDVLKRSGFAYI
jgi:hypothetical protein